MTRTSFSRRPADRAEQTGPADQADRVEQRTIEALSQGGRWLITSKLCLDGVDVDHVVVTPAVVLAVQTKSHSRTDRSWTATQPALDAAQRAARQVRLLLQSSDLHTRCEVIAALIVCGPGQPELPGGCRRDGQVWVLDGTRPQLWTDLVDVNLLAQDLRNAVHGIVQHATAQYQQRGAA